MPKALIILDNDLIHDGRVLKELAILDKHNIDYKVLCYDYGKDYENDKRIIRISYGQFIKYKLEAIVNTFPIVTWVWARKIKEVLQTFKADLIHVHDLYMMPPVSKALKNFKVKPKLILDLHENFPYAIYNYTYATKGIKRLLVKPEKWKEKERNILEKSDTIIVLDKSFGESLKDKYPTLKQKEFVEFPNYPDYKILDECESIDFSIDQTKPVMLYFGGVAYSRGITESIQAFKELVAKGSKLKYLIIGPINKAYREEFLSLIKDPAISSNIQYVPWIKVSQLKTIMKQCSFAIAPFHVNPQIESGIANKIFQYLYGGLPVVVSNAKPMAKLVTENICGLVFNEKNEIISCMEKYINDPALLSNHSKNGIRTIVEKYKPQKFEKALIASYGIV